MPTEPRPPRRALPHPAAAAFGTDYCVLAEPFAGGMVGGIYPWAAVAKPGAKVLPCDGRTFDPLRYPLLAAHLPDVWGGAPRGERRLPYLPRADDPEKPCETA